MSTITVKELAAPTGFDLKIAAGETLDLKSQGTVTMPTGTILRQFFTRITGNLDTTSTSYVDLGGSITLTPLSTSSKFFIMTSVHSYLSNHSDDAWHAINYQILRDSTVVTGGDVTNGSYGFARHTTSDSDRNMQYVHRQFQDEPSTTSQIIYKIQVQSRFGYAANFNEFGESSMAILEVQG
jgi:hypothetical protein